MNEVMDFGKTILGGADGPTSIFLAGGLGTGVKAAMIVVGLLLCFAGLKLSRVLAALVGLAVGISAGAAAAMAAGTKGTVSLVIILACGAVAAFLSGFFHKLGAFLLVFFLMLGAFASIFTAASGFTFAVSLGGKSLVMGGIALAVSTIFAVLAVVFSDPVIVAVTAIFGGLSAGPAILSLAGLSLPPFAGYVVSVVFIVLGMGVQFVMQSRKIGRKEKIYAEEKKETDSVESEVEKARNILEDDEEE